MNVQRMNIELGKQQNMHMGRQGMADVDPRIAAANKYKLNPKQVVGQPRPLNQGANM